MDYFDSKDFDDTSLPSLDDMISAGYDEESAQHILDYCPEEANHLCELMARTNEIAANCDLFLAEGEYLDAIYGSEIPLYLDN